MESVIEPVPLAYALGDASQKFINDIACRAYYILNKEGLEVNTQYISALSHAMFAVDVLGQKFSENEMKEVDKFRKILIKS